MNDTVLILGNVPPEAVMERFVAARVRRFENDDSARAEFIAAHGASVAAVIAGGGVDAALMDALPNLKIAACFGVGYDGIEVAAATARGVWVSNTPDVLNDDVADYALAMMLAVTREVPQTDRYVRDGLWRARGNYALTDHLYGKRLGLLGIGRIGSVIARRALAFDMDISYHARSEKPGLPYRFAPTPVELAAGCDVLCVVMPATEATRNIVGAEALRALGGGGYLINIARASLVDEAALISALKDGVIKGAALDVFADEPNVPAELIALDNVVLSPHQGSATVRTRRLMAALAADNVAAVLAGGAPLTPVNQPNI